MTNPRAPSSPSSHPAVLIVDDAAPLRDAIARYLSQQGYPCETVGSGPAALAALQREPKTLMLLDIKLPGMSGIEVVSEALAIDPSLAIIMLSGIGDATTAATCMQRGALDYLVKPIELTELARAIEQAVRRRATALQTHELTSWLREEAEHRAAEVEQERQRHERLVTATLHALINALEAKNPYLGGHSARVGALAATIADELGLTADAIEEVRVAGRLHDLGMIGIREDVLNKHGHLSADEYAHIKQHVVVGADILRPLGHLGPIVGYVRSHHEHWNGGGYPDGLGGEDIPLGARILAVTEVYDALTTARPYQAKRTPEEAVAQLRELAGTVLDPHVVAALERAVARRHTLVFLDDETAPPDEGTAAVE